MLRDTSVRLSVLFARWLHGMSASAVSRHSKRNKRERDKRETLVIHELRTAYNTLLTRVGTASTPFSFRSVLVAVPVVNTTRATQHLREVLGLGFTLHWG